MVVTCLDVCIIYFISCDCIMNSYNILKIAEIDCCQIIILSIYIYVPSTHLHTLRHMSYIFVCLSLDFPYETNTGACVESKICSLDNGDPLKTRGFLGGCQCPASTFLTLHNRL